MNLTQKIHGKLILLEYVKQNSNLRNAGENPLHFNEEMIVRPLE